MIIIIAPGAVLLFFFIVWVVFDPLAAFISMAVLLVCGLLLLVLVNNWPLWRWSDVPPSVICVGLGVLFTTYFGLLVNMWRNPTPNPHAAFAKKREPEQ